MFNNISYNVVIERFKVFADGHYLIRRFTHGQIDQTDLDKDQQFPWMHVAPVEVRAAAGARVFTFDVIFADIPRDKEDKTDYQKESISDCIRLAEDLISEIQNGQTVFGPDVEVEGESTITPFIEEWTHTLSGCTLALTITVPNNYSACDIPADWSIGGGSGAVPPSPLPGIILRVNTIDNVNQHILDLTAGANMTITDLGDGRVKFDATGDLGTNWGTIGGLLSDQTDLWNALLLKADISSLGAAAFSNDYNDLDNLPTIPTELDDLTDVNTPSPSNGQVLTWNGTEWVAQTPASSVGTVTSVGLSVPTPATPAFSVSSSPVTTSGTIQLNALGTTSQYIDGIGALQTFPAIPKTIGDLLAGTQKGDLIQWDGSKWVVIHGLDIDNLNDVTINSPSNGQVLQYNGTAWVNVTPTTPTAQGLQDVITEDNVLTQNNIIDVNTFGFTIDDTSSFYVNSTNKVNLNVNGESEFALDPTSASISQTSPGSNNQIIVDQNGISIQGSDGIGITQLTLDANALKVVTPNVDGGSASVGQVLTLQNVNGTVEFTTVSAGGGSVTSVGLSVPAPVNPAFSVTGSPVTTSGTLAIGANGTSSQYVDGTGALQTMPTGLPPTGAAGGDLAGTYPNPTVDGIHGIDMQSGTPNTNDAWIYGGSPAKWQHQHINAGIVDNDSAVTGTTVKDALDHLNTTKVETTRSISTSSPLSGGGDLSANRTISIADAVADGSTKGAAAFTASDFNSSSGVISIDYTNGQKASAAQPGFLTAADWSTFNSKPSGDSIAFASNPNISQAAGSTNYWAITGSGAPNATENARVIVMPCAGTLKNLYVRIGALQSSGGTMVFTLRKNAADTAITITFANADGSNVTKSDTTNTVSVAAGDTISIKGVNNAPSSASGTFVSFSLLLERS